MGTRSPDCTQEWICAGISDAKSPRSRPTQSKSPGFFAVSWTSRGTVVERVSRSSGSESHRRDYPLDGKMDPHVSAHYLSRYPDTQAVRLPMVDPVPPDVGLVRLFLWIAAFDDLLMAGQVL